MSLYLEISGRRTGKTNRLISAAVDCAKAGNKTMIIVGNYRMKKFHEKVNKRKFATIEVFSELEIRNMAEMDRCEEQSIFNDYRIFYDEFDFFDFNKNKLPIMENGYYCTTPRFLRRSNTPPENPRDDVLLYLYNKNDVIHVHNINTDIISDFDYLPNTEKFGSIF